MPERVEAVEFVKVTGMEDNKAYHIEDREKLYYQRRSMPVIISPPDSSTTVERSGIPEDSKITIVQGQDSLYPQGRDSLYPGGKSRCSLWMLWLKFSSFLYLVLILLLILWALHQYKEAQEKDTPLYQHQARISSSPSALVDNGEAMGSKALLHQSLKTQTKELLEWEMTSDSYTIGSDITYKDRRFYINTPGYYEVQCRLQFDTYSNIVPNQDVHVVFSVIRSTRSQDNRNLMSEKSTLEPKEFRGIQLGPTVFRLEANDSVYVSVLKHQFVYPTRDNYFAIRKIE